MSLIPKPSLTGTINAVGDLKGTNSIAQVLKGTNSIAQVLKGDKGEKGEPGENGKDGQDGFSPTVGVKDITGGHRVTITDKEGAKTFDVMDGKDGQGGSGGGGSGVTVQADWSVNDPDADGYVKNRTHWVEQFRATWDCNPDGRDSFDATAAGMCVFYKISDETLPAEHFEDTIIYSNPSTYEHYTETLLSDATVGTVALYGTTFIASANIAVDLTSTYGFAIPSPGVYIGFTAQEVYDTELYIVGPEVIHKIPLEFIPDHGIPALEILPHAITVTVDGEPYIDTAYFGEITASERDAYQAGLYRGRGKLYIQYVRDVGTPNLYGVLVDLSYNEQTQIASGSTVLTIFNPTANGNGNTGSLNSVLITVVVEFENERIIVSARSIPDKFVTVDDIISALPIYNGEVAEV
jgi:hypothetical protein